MLKAVFFDLDGTLLPMDQDLFIKTYFGAIAKKMASHGYEPESFVKAVWQGTMQMIKNNGEKTNEARFWESIVAIYGEDALKDEAVLAEFYETEFDKISSVCQLNERSRELIELLKSKGARLILATNPVFPKIATQKRIKWAGLSPEDFEYITTYENASYCKPNPAYYKEILDAVGLEGSDCLMVGNDVGDDMVAKSLGMRVFLLTDCLINSKNADISEYEKGGFDELFTYINSLI